METILTVVDFKSGTARLVAETCKYAKALHANVILVNMEPLLPGTEGTDKNDVTRDFEDGYDDEIQTILGLGEELTAQGITHRELIIEGTAAEQLLLAAEREAASLVIIGSYPHGALVEALTHGLREQLAKKAPCPVLLVPVR